MVVPGEETYIKTLRSVGTFTSIALLLHPSISAFVHGLELS